MMERPRRRALPRAAKKTDPRREENASGCRVIVIAPNDGDDIKVLFFTRLSLYLVL
jgi:hypothetical protein